MSKLQALIQELCPNGVEYKQLGDKTVSTMQRGTSLTKKDSMEGVYPVISGGRIPAFYCDRFNRDGETITVAGSGAGAGFVQYWNEKIFVCDAFSVKGVNDVSTKYLYYCLTNLQDKIYATKKGGGVPHVHISSIDKFLIPVPPLAVQEEIVKILDRFAEYAAELQAELQARQEQYEHYKNKLLHPSSNDVTIMTLRDICHLSRGKVYSKEYLNSHIGDYPVYSSQTANDGKLGCIDSFDYDGEYLTWTTDGAYAGTIFHRKGKFSITNVCGLISLSSDDILIRFLYYWLSITAKKYVYHGMGNPKLMSNQMGGIEIPIPPIEVQKKIVAILDRFDALVNGLTLGLPAEITAVQEQYEYYRNKLLSFPSNRVSA